MANFNELFTLHLKILVKYQLRFVIFTHVKINENSSLKSSENVQAVLRMPVT